MSDTMPQGGYQNQIDYLAKKLESAGGSQWENIVFHANSDSLKSAYGSNENRFKFDMWGAEANQSNLEMLLDYDEVADEDYLTMSRLFEQVSAQGGVAPAYNFPLSLTMAGEITTTDTANLSSYPPSESLLRIGIANEGRYNPNVYFYVPFRTNEDGDGIWFSGSGMALFNVRTSELETPQDGHVYFTFALYNPTTGRQYSFKTSYSAQVELNGFLMVINPPIVGAPY